ncbi:MAG TPA: hypothetical protein VFA26_05250 [Gemmataceae bacterium]|nr:hypothetical protein [Gemmataceae bacterium]
MLTDRPPVCSPDFSYVNGWTFTPTQARCLAVLWQAHERGLPFLTGEVIRHQAGTLQDRLDHVFRLRGRRRHPAWGRLIQAVGKGQYRLDLSAWADAREKEH